MCFLYKQNTTYDMRISDWSSYVCSSDLIRELMTHIPAPDFPTAGLLLDAAGLVDAYNTGRGRIVVRGRTHFEDIGHDKQAIIVTELPNQVNRARLLARIAELVKVQKTGRASWRDSVCQYVWIWVWEDS